jgi:lipid II:glycine glycyltransferase (peptidoglycan interpeptide bridge formation enzyme)
MIDIRQSDNWARYLETLGWHFVKTKAGVNIEFKKLGPVSLVKIQRPRQLSQKDLEEFEQLCKQNKSLFIKIEPWIEQNLEVLEKNGYHISNAPLAPPTTIYIDLVKSKEELWHSVSRSGKYSIRRAQREGVRVEYFKNPSEELLKEFYGVEADTGKKKKFYVQSLQDLKAKAEEFGDECYIIKVFDGENNLCGMNFYLGFKGNIWFIHGGTTDTGRKNKTGYDLVWQAILYFKELGYKVMDLEGKDDDRFPAFTKDWGGFSHFKEKFGGEVVEFPKPRIKYLNPFLKFIAKFNTNLPL